LLKTYLRILLDCEIETLKEFIPIINNFETNSSIFSICSFVKQFWLRMLVFNLSFE